jgi:hypothetical protein
VGTDDHATEAGKQPANAANVAALRFYRDWFEAARDNIQWDLKIKNAEDAEAAYLTKKEQYKATIVADRTVLAKRWLRVVARISAMIEHSSNLLWVGVETLFDYGLQEDIKARLGTRFRVEAPPPPPANDNPDHKPPGSTR